MAWVPRQTTPVPRVDNAIRRPPDHGPATAAPGKYPREAKLFHFNVSICFIMICIPQEAMARDNRRLWSIEGLPGRS